MRQCFKITMLFLCWSLATKAQEQFGPTPSPSGSSNGVQNSLFDGTATVSVPFFSQQVDGVPINVTAVYQTKGIKVDQIASTIGIGWELMCGGSIIRIQRDLIDEAFIPTMICTNPPPYVTVLPEYPVGSWMDQTGYTMTDIFKDSELDEFFLQLPTGRSVKFVIDRDGNVTTIPDSKLKIRRRIVGGNFVTNKIPLPNLGTMLPELKFEVTDEAGNIFNFMRGDYELVPYTTYHPSASQNQCTTPPPELLCTKKWVLESILTYEGSFITFKYKTFTPVSLLTNRTSNLQVVQTSQPPANITPIVKDNYYNGVIVGIEEIEMPNGTKVLFTYDQNFRKDLPGVPALTKISTQDQIGYSSPTAISYNLDYDYCVSFPAGYNSFTYVEPYNTTSTWSGVERWRLRLKSISKSGIGGAPTAPHYKFTYNTDYMPPRGSAEQDVYGYYNGKFGIDEVNSGLPWEHKSFQTVTFIHWTIPKKIGIDKSSDAVYAKALSLTKVENSLGGMTEFVYDDNMTPSQFSTALQGATSTTSAIDGIRLASQVDFDGYKTENSIKTTYQYFNGQIFLGESASNFWYPIVCNGIADVYVYYNSFLSSFQLVNGSNHGHGLVKVQKHKHPFNQSDFLGETEHYFSLADASKLTYSAVSAAYAESKTGIPTNNLLSTTNDLSASGSSNFYTPFHLPPFTYKQYLKSWQIGLPIETVTKDHNGLILSRDLLKYECVTLTPPGSSSNGSNWCKKSMVKIVDCNASPLQYYEDDYYTVTGNTRVIQRTNEIYYSNNDKLETTTNFQYVTTLNHASKRGVDIRSVSSTNSKGQAEAVHTYYNYDWSANQGSAIAQLNQEGVTKPVLTEKWRGIGGSSVLLNVQASGYNLVTVFPVPAVSWFTKSVAKATHSYKFLTGSEGVTGYTSFGPGNFNMHTASQGGFITNFQFLGHAANFTAQGYSQDFITTDGRRTATLYEGKERLVVAEIANASSSDIAYESFEAPPPSQYNSILEHQGNWQHQENVASLSSLSVPPQLSGSYALKLESNNGTPRDVIKTVQNLNSGKDYYVSFWTYGSHLPVVKDNTNTLSLQHVQTLNGWKQYSCTFTSTGGQLSINRGSGDCYIDELRLHPSDAQMTTYNYEALKGVSSTCDANNTFKFFEYDQFGRQTTVKNHWGEIISHKQFVEQGND